MKYILLLTALLASTAFAAQDFDETMAAAKQGKAYAQYNLGLMYATGSGFAKNDVEAAKWFREAAHQGNVSAQFALGNSYISGSGVAKDAALALLWFGAAASEGHVEARAIVRQLEFQDKQRKGGERKRQREERKRQQMTVGALSLLGILVMLLMANRSLKETPQQKIWRQEEEQRQLKELERQQIKQQEELERQQIKQQEELERQRKEQKELKQKRQQKEQEEELERQRKEQEELKRQQKERRLKDTLSLMQRSLPFFCSVTDEEGSESHAGKLRWRGVLQAVTATDESDATLYFVKLLSLLDNKEYYKIGMTAKSVEERFETSTQTELLEVVATYAAARYLVLFAEYHFIREFEITYELSKLPDMSGPDVKFSGSSEVVRANARGKISGFFEKLKGYEDKVVKGVVELV